MSNSSPITVAYGDGIGPEIMDACLHVIKEAGARHRHWLFAPTLGWNFK